VPSDSLQCGAALIFSAIQGALKMQKYLKSSFIINSFLFLVVENKELSSYENFWKNS